MFQSIGESDTAPASDKHLGVSPDSSPALAMGPALPILRCSRDESIGHIRLPPSLQADAVECIKRHADAAAGHMDDLDMPLTMGVTRAGQSALEGGRRAWIYMRT